MTYNQDSTPLFDAYAWAYDPVSRVTSFDSRDGLQEYQYDLTSQLTDVEIDSTPAEDHQYVLNGKRTNSGYVTGDNNQLLEDGTYTYLYDGEGNRIRRTHDVSGVVTTFDWDYRNRLERVTDWEDGTLTTATQIVAFMRVRHARFEYDSQATLGGLRKLRKPGSIAGLQAVRSRSARLSVSFTSNANEATFNFGVKGIPSPIQNTPLLTVALVMIPKRLGQNPQYACFRG